MINLAPIPARIQQRMFEKMQALSKPTEYPNSNSSTLTFDQMATRSPYIRMVSGQTNAVILTAGKVEAEGVDGGPMLGGFDNIYGPRTYKKSGEKGRSVAEDKKAFEDDFDNYDYRPGEKASAEVIQNSSRRPMPGVVSIDVSFKGGVRALREASIKWKCYSWSELNELMPHFLAHGKTVMVEWGWVYANQGILTPSFLETDEAGNRYIKADAFKSPINEVLNRNGDLDVITGIIKNFSFTTDTDGAFDCETKITSVGISLMENTLPAENVLDPGQTFNLNLREDTKEVARKLRDATGEQTTFDTGWWDISNYDASKTQKGKDRILDLNSGVTLKAVLNNIEKILLEDHHDNSDTDKTYGTTSIKESGDILTSGQINHAKNKYILYEKTAIIDTDHLEPDDCWVRWGWFEDNILSKFLSVTTADGGIITEFRSIENIITQAGEPTGQYESVRIRNHEYLETVNYNSYILPGQFFIQETWDEKTNLKEDETKLEQQPKEEPAANIKKDESTSKANPTVAFESETLGHWLRTAESFGLYERRRAFRDSVLNPNGIDILSSTVDVNILRAIIQHDDLSADDLERVETRLKAVQNAQRIANENNRPLNMGIINTEEDRLTPIRVEVKLPGDSKKTQTLAKIANDTDNFSSFATETDTIEKVESITHKVVSGDTVGVIAKKYGVTSADIVKLNKLKNANSIQVGQELLISGQNASSEKAKPGKYGYLRNMLINTKVIKQAFGVGEDYTIEAINIVEALEGMFAVINAEFNYWNFQVTTDSLEDYRVKIIDEHITDFDFNKKTTDQMSKFDNGQVKVDDEGKAGVFFFPTWRTDSFVKSQDITAKIPDAMAMATMYGGNMNQLKDFNNPGNQFGDTAGVIVGGLFNNDKDQTKQALDIAYRNETTREIGNDTGDANDPLTADGGKNIFANLSTKDLESKYETRLGDIDKNIQAIAKESEAQKVRLMFDDSVPPPPPRLLGNKKLHALLKGETDIEGYTSEEKRNEIKNLYGQKYEGNGKLKKAFLKGVSYLTTNHGKYKNSTLPVLIPMDLELSIDGIGGIYPGNSFHSYYLPTRYRKDTVFQAFDVNHTVSTAGWTTTISGKMRSTKGSVFIGVKALNEIEQKLVINMENKMVDNIKKAMANKKEDDANKLKREIYEAQLAQDRRRNQPRQ
tara:strand:- start:3731 stop:7228 length:3498 start_codon:yes stop_codon:yes gene_type:complete